jgi:aspartate-semialdehyde dehydrogenase
MKTRVGILGVTGSVGQKFVQLLAGHPWFEITAIAASDRSSGRQYREAVSWFQTTPLPERIADMEIRPCEPNLDCDYVFSALDAAVAGEIEIAFADAGYVVYSNARNHRMDPDVPLLVPEVNAKHLELIRSQHRKGSIITNPNCSTIGLVMALKPLVDAFGVKEVQVVTLQALSGAGYPGVSSLDILDNVIPFISGEEEKMELEPLKILGELTKTGVKPHDLRISAQCNRVAVQDGHTECVSLKLKLPARPEDLIQAWTSFRAEPQRLDLPSAPAQPIHYFHEPNYPQPKLHRSIDKGMAVSIGRLRACPLLDYKFVLLSHNTIRGAAGGAILNAELYRQEGHEPIDKE